MDEFPGHADGSELKRLVHLFRWFGIAKTVSVCLGALDDRHLKSFDRRYGVRTSGHLELSKTSFDCSKLQHATSYGAVNAWAFRKLLKELNLPKRLHFADLGCGLGRACILAAEYGFEKVTGVELAHDLCVKARENISRCRLAPSTISSVSIVHADVLDYCAHTEDDIFFIYRAFSLELFRTVRRKLAERATHQNKPMTLIYTERLNWPSTREVRELSDDHAFRKAHETNMFGQAFYVYRCGASF